MKTIRQQAAEWGNPVVGKLHRTDDYLLQLRGKEILLPGYNDVIGAEYTVEAATNKIATLTTADRGVM